MLLLRCIILDTAIDGTSGSPQMTIENNEMEAKAMQNEERVET